MKKLLLMAWLGTLLACPAAQAGDLLFNSAQYEATAVAAASDAAPGVAADAGAMGPDLISVSTDSVGVMDVATAGALVSLGQLGTAADVAGSGLSSATAVARFTASFVNAGPVDLGVEYSWTSFADGSGQATTTLFISLVSGGVTLFADYVNGPWQFAYNPAVGSTSVLDLTLSSEVSVAFASVGSGNASAQGLASITNAVSAVPEPASAWMFAAALVVFAVRRQRLARGA